MMIKQLTGMHAYSFGALAIGRLRRAGAIPCLIAAMLLITACDKSSTSAPQKAQSPEGPPPPEQTAQQTATPDEPKNPDNPLAMSRYTNAKNGFAIDFPAPWKLEKDPDGLFAIMASSPQKHPRDAFSENAYVMVKELPTVTADGVPRQLSLNDYFDLSRANFPKISNDAVELEIGQIVVNQQPCPWVIFTHVFNNVNLMTIRYYLHREQKVFVIACTATPESFGEYSDTFRQIANSITFE